MQQPWVNSYTLAGHSATPTQDTSPPARDLVIRTRPIQTCSKTQSIELECRLRESKKKTNTTQFPGWANPSHPCAPGRPRFGRQRCPLRGTGSPRRPRLQGYRASGHATPTPRGDELRSTGSRFQISWKVGSGGRRNPCQYGDVLSASAGSGVAPPPAGLHPAAPQGLKELWTVPSWLGCIRTESPLRSTRTPESLCTSEPPRSVRRTAIRKKRCNRPSESREGLPSTLTTLMREPSSPRPFSAPLPDAAVGPVPLPEEVWCTIVLVHASMLAGGSPDPSPVRPPTGGRSSLLSPDAEGCINIAMAQGTLLVAVTQHLTPCHAVLQAADVALGSSPQAIRIEHAYLICSNTLSIEL